MLTSCNSPQNPDRSRCSGLLLPTTCQLCNISHLRPTVYFLIFIIYLSISARLTQTVSLALLVPRVLSFVTGQRGSGGEHQTIKCFCSTRRPFSKQVENLVTARRHLNFEFAFGVAETPRRAVFWICVFYLAAHRLTKRISNYCPRKHHLRCAYDCGVDLPKV